MTLLPGTNYLSDSARTEAEMKVALDKVNEVIAEIGSKEVTTLTIDSGGGLSTPLSSMVSVATYQGASTDILSTISVSNIDQGRMVILQHALPASTEATGITITHGTGAAGIDMKDSMNFILCAKRMLGLIYTGDRWSEVWRGYGRSTAEEKLAEREDIGLGDASVETIATAGSNAGKVLKVGTALTTGDVLKIDAAGQIAAATITTNADTLDNHDSTEFVRKTGGAAQSIDDDLTVAAANASLIADGTTTAALRLKGTGSERARVILDETNGELMLRTQTAGGAATPSIRLNPGGAAGEKFQFAVDDSTWQSLTPGAGNGLNADQLDGHEWSEVPLIGAMGYRRTHLKGSTQSNLGYWNSSGQPQNEYGEPLVDMMDIEYPITPNGVRRFTVNASVCFKATSTDTSSREGRFAIYTHQIGANIRYPGNPNWVNYFFYNQISNPQENTYYTAVAVERTVTPAVDDVLSVLAGEDQERNTAAMADVGHGSLSTPVGGSTTSSGSRGRTFVQITYLDEG